MSRCDSRAASTSPHHDHSDQPDESVAERFHRRAGQGQWSDDNADTVAARNWP
jgi:hypothetical protein